MSIDIFRGTDGLALPPSVSDEIWANVQHQSIIQQLGQQTELPGQGAVIPIIEGDPEAEWVNETDEKPVRRSLFANRAIKGYTLAVIEPFSNQFRRDLPGLYAALLSRLPRALAKKYDRSAFGYVAGPGNDFDSLADVITVDITMDPFDGLLDALRSVVGSDEDGAADITAWCLTPLGEVDLLGAKDNDGRPLLTSSVAEGSIGQILGRPVYKTPHVGDAATNVVGVAGDWSSVLWGYVQGITVSVSDQATLTDADGKTLNLWQRNMFALRAECEIGFAARDHGRFVKLVNTGAGSETEGGETP
ncbi:phage major capsid protein [Mycobacterium sp. 20091114027_K0903767]|nr:phage major capsid protein [Mycobacterium sp. 20091114027_K0903767]